jgi:uncharacterized repeat protein (TIGR03803 family)
MITGLTFVRAALGALFLACLIAAASPAAAQKEWTVYSFAADGSQGIGPLGSLIPDNDGNLYGTTTGGGAFGPGTVYELVRPVPPKTGWTEKVLYSFTGGADGGSPYGGLVFDNMGNLYGTTTSGGLVCNDAPGCGVVFELSPPATTGSPWTESVLYSFSGTVNGDGTYPVGELIRDGAGNLYGITGLGGEINLKFCNGTAGCGTVFQLSPPATPGGAWTETILHSFVYQQGALPQDRPVSDSQGNLYGTAQVGGPFRNGVVYRLLRPATAGGAWTYKVLHAFGAITTGSPEGAAPFGGITLHGKRVLYGTTEEGGLYGAGTVFQLEPPSVPNGKWTESILHSFGGPVDVIDGTAPRDRVIFDSRGNMYGTTVGSNGNAFGTVFELAPPASDGPWTETVLYGFSGNDINGKRDGNFPYGPLIFGKNGVLFGSALEGGNNNTGAIFGVLP